MSGLRAVRLTLSALLFFQLLSPSTASHWANELPPAPPPGKTDKYNPLLGTADGARTWNPYYPPKQEYEHVDATFVPACPWKKKPDGMYVVVKDCDADLKKDVHVILSIKYAILQPPKDHGFVPLGDAPDEELTPFITSVTDDKGSDLKWHLFRSEKQWFIMYTFESAIEERAYYSVNLEYNLRDVIKGDKGSNKFDATWLSQWNGPVKKLAVQFAFPKGFAVKDYSIVPGNTEGQDHGGGEGQVRGQTSVCCGDEPKKQDQMEICTADKSLSLEWFRGEGQCEDKTVMLSTELTLPLSDGEYANADDGVLSNSEAYEIKFWPGLVDNPDAEGVNEAKVAWWVWLLALAVIFPGVAAVIYTLARYGAPDFFTGKGPRDHDDGTNISHTA